MYELKGGQGRTADDVWAYGKTFVVLLIVAVVAAFVSLFC